MARTVRPTSVKDHGRTISGKRLLRAREAILRGREFILGRFSAAQTRTS